MVSETSAIHDPSAPIGIAAYFMVSSFTFKNPPYVFLINNDFLMVENKQTAGH